MVKYRNFPLRSRSLTPIWHFIRGHSQQKKEKERKKGNKTYRKYARTHKQTIGINTQIQKITG